MTRHTFTMVVLLTFACVVAHAQRYPRIAGNTNEMLAMPVPEPSTITILKGYASSNENVFLPFQYVRTSTATPNGTSIFQPTFVPFSGPVGVGRYLLMTISTNAGGSGTLTGGGTNNYVAKWSGATALTNSLIYDDGTNVGIGTITPAAPLHVNGTIAVAGITNSAGTANTLQAFGANKEEKSVALSGATFDGTTLTITPSAGGFTNTATAVLTYGATVTPDIDAIPNITRNCPRDVTLTLTLTGNVTTLNVPTATPIHGDRVTFEFIQDSTGNRTVAPAAGYRFGTDITTNSVLALSTNATWTDWTVFKYTTNAARWDAVGHVRGYH